MSDLNKNAIATVGALISENESLKKDVAYYKEAASAIDSNYGKLAQNRDKILDENLILKRRDSDFQRVEKNRAEMIRNITTQNADLKGRLDAALQANRVLSDRLNAKAPIPDVNDDTKEHPTPYQPNVTHVTPLPTNHGSFVNTDQTPPGFDDFIEALKSMGIQMHGEGMPTPESAATTRESVEKARVRVKAGQQQSSAQPSLVMTLPQFMNMVFSGNK